MAKIFLRVAIAFTLLYAGIFSLLSPEDWLWYIPIWLQNIVHGETQLLLHGIFEVLLGLWLLSGWKGFYASLIATADLAVITLLNYSIMDVVFRDVGLVLAGAALASLYKEDIKNSKK